MNGLLSRRQMLGAFAASGLTTFGAGSLPQAAAKPAVGLNVLGAPNASTMVLVEAMQSAAFKAAAPDSTFRLWRELDDLMASIVSGRTLLFTTPTNLPAILASRGLPIKMLCIVSMGHLFLVSSDPKIKTIADLKGQEVLGFFRNGMPDLVFRSLLIGAGLNPDTDVKLTYVQTGMEAAQMVASGRATTAILSEPPATAAIMMAKHKENRTLYRAVDLQEVWKAQHGLGLPMAGIAVHQKLIEEYPEVMAALKSQLVPARDWVMNDLAASAPLAEKTMGIKPEIFTMAIEHFNVVADSAESQKPGLVEFYKTLLAMKPESVGGQLPPDSFYLSM